MRDITAGKALQLLNSRNVPEVLNASKAFLIVNDLGEGISITELEMCSSACGVGIYLLTFKLILSQAF